MDTYNNKQFSVTKNQICIKSILLSLKKNTEIEFTIGQMIQTNIFILLAMIVGFCLNVYTLLIKKMIHMLYVFVSLFASPFTISEDVF